MSILERLIDGVFDTIDKVLDTADRFYDDICEILDNAQERRNFRLLAELHDRKQTHVWRPAIMKGQPSKHCVGCHTTVKLNETDFYTQFGKTVQEYKLQRERMS